jgi:hypothetical protein
MDGVQAAEAIHARFGVRSSSLFTAEPMNGRVNGVGREPDRFPLQELQECSARIGNLAISAEGEDIIDDFFSVRAGPQRQSSARRNLIEDGSA